MQTHSEQLNELFGALSKAQGQIKTAVKDSANPFFKSSYTSLDGCWEACRIPLSTNGLTIVQTIKQEGDKFYLTTVLGHASGQFISSTMPLLLAKNDPQSFGSACSYARRYSLCAIVGLTQGDDDDGEKAMSGHRSEAKSRQPKPDANLSQEPEKIIGLVDEEFYNYLFAHLPEYKDPSFGSSASLTEYINTLVTSQISAQKIMKQATSSEEMTRRFCTSWLNWHTNRSKKS